MKFDDEMAMAVDDVIQDARQDVIENRINHMVQELNQAFTERVQVKRCRIYAEHIVKTGITQDEFKQVHERLCLESDRFPTIKDIVSLCLKMVHSRQGAGGTGCEKCKYSGSVEYSKEQELTYFGDTNFYLEPCQCVSGRKTRASQSNHTKKDTDGQQGANQRDVKYSYSDYVASLEMEKQ